MRHMDYEKFKKEYDEFEEYNMNRMPYESINKKSLAWLDVRNKYGKQDMVNSPAHYTRGSQEVIDIIEQAIVDAPTNAEGYLQGQALKYLLRVWLKDNPKQDCEKAVWYLNRLIDKLE